LGGESDAELGTVMVCSQRPNVSVRQL
jgi:hypothetical protein